MARKILTQQRSTYIDLMPPPTDSDADLQVRALTRLLQLASSTLPTGAFAYSQGLESMVSLGWLGSEQECIDNLRTLMAHALVNLEVPCFLRLHRAWQGADLAAVQRTRDLLFACRESSEMQSQDRQTARAVWRVLKELNPSACPADWEPKTFAEMFALACTAYALGETESATAFGYTWCEQHVNALARLWPLGPLAGQRVLDALLQDLPRVVAQAALISDDEIGAASPRLGLACILHETQYSRLFRS